MTDIDRAFRDAGQMPVEDLWPDILTRTPGKPPSRPPGSRAKVIVVAVAVAILGIGFLVQVFSEGSIQPATPTPSQPVISPGLRCSVSYSFSHGGPVYDYYRYRVDVQNERNRGSWIDVGINLVGATDVYPDGVSRFRVYVAARSVKTVSNWFRALQLSDVKLDHCTSNASPDLAAVLPGGGYSPKLSPDGTTIAFLRDPYDQHRRDMGMNPYVLQVWLIDLDGSSLRKVGQEPGCCVAISGDIRWSKDGSSIVLIGSHRQRIDLATGRSR